MQHTSLLLPLCVQGLLTQSTGAAKNLAATETPFWQEPAFQNQAQGLPECFESAIPVHWANP